MKVNTLSKNYWFSGQQHPVKRRTIMCVDYKENALSDASCSNIEERPTETELCDINLPYCDEDDNENSNMIWTCFILYFCFIANACDKRFNCNGKIWKFIEWKTNIVAYCSSTLLNTYR